MTKPKAGGAPDTTGGKPSTKRIGTAVKTARKQRTRHGDNTPAKTGAEKPTAFIVSGVGTDDEIRARCAQEVEGWDDLGPRSKNDMVRLMREFEQGSTAPRMELKKDSEGALTIGPPDEANVTLHALRTVEMMGSSSQEYVNARVSQLVNCGQGSGSATSDKISADMAFVHGGKAEDTVQSSLLVQMAVTHDAAMKALRMVAQAQHMETAKLYANLAPKLLNAYTRQAETLNKLQHGGEQIVRHIYVDNRGGQAVVADRFISNKGGLRAETRNHSHALSAPLWRDDPTGVALPSTTDQGPKALPHAQWTGEGDAWEPARP